MLADACMFRIATKFWPCFDQYQPFARAGDLGPRFRGRLGAAGDEDHREGGASPFCPRITSWKCKVKATMPFRSQVYHSQQTTPSKVDSARLSGRRHGSRLGAGERGHYMS